MRIYGSSFLVESSRRCTGFTSCIEVLLTAKFFTRNLPNSLILQSIDSDIIRKFSGNLPEDEAIYDLVYYKHRQVEDTERELNTRWASNRGLMDLF